MPTVTLPLTVAPCAGVEKPAVSCEEPFCTVTGMLPVPVLLLGSRTDAVSVVGPSGVPVVIHGMLMGPLDVSFVVATVWPAAIRVNVFVPAAAFSIQMVTHCVPVTVELTGAPSAGALNESLGVPPFRTLTVRVAVAVAPALSRTVRPSVWLVLLYPFVVHEYVLDPLDVTWVPSIVSV